MILWCGTTTCWSVCLIPARAAWSCAWGWQLQRKLNTSQGVRHDKSEYTIHHDCMYFHVLAGFAITKWVRVYNENHKHRQTQREGGISVTSGLDCICRLCKQRELGAKQSSFSSNIQFVWLEAANIHRRTHTERRECLRGCWVRGSGIRLCAAAKGMWEHNSHPSFARNICARTHRTHTYDHTVHFYALTQSECRHTPLTLTHMQK